MYSQDCHDITKKQVARDLHFYIEGARMAFNMQELPEETITALTKKFYDAFSVDEELFDRDSVLRRRREIKKQLNGINQ